MNDRKKEKNTGLGMNSRCKDKTEVSRSGLYAESTPRGVMWSKLSERLVTIGRKQVGAAQWGALFQP